MIIWIFLTVLTAIVLAALLRPLYLPSDELSGDGAADLAVYRDQLRSLEAERSSGLIGDVDFQAGEVEVSRRLLAAAQRVSVDGNADVSTGHAIASSVTHRSSRYALAICSGLLIAPAFAMYVWLGSPALKGQPHHVRIAEALENRDISALVARVEAELQRNPEDGRGWDALAPVYLRQGRFRQAESAYRNALRLQGPSAARLDGFAEAIIQGGNGIVSEEARLILVRLLKLDPNQPKPRFYLGVAKEQDGRIEEAIVIYRDLLEGASKDAIWRQFVEKRIVALTGKPPPDSIESAKSAPADSSTAERGPTSKDIESAQNLSAEERSQMINQMVGQLAERLKQDGSNLKGWLRLIRSYAVLDRPSEARSALDNARRQFSSDVEALKTLDSLAKQLAL